MKFICLRWIVALGTISIALTHSCAQPVFKTIESIEAIVANSDYIIIGKIVTLRNEDTCNATVVIDETLKGYEDEERKVCVRFSEPARMLAEWKDRSQQLLFIMGEGTNRTVLDLSKTNLEIMASDFKVLRNSAEVIRVVKETVRRIPAAVKRLHTFQVQVPQAKNPELEKHPWLVLIVPVDDRLEKRARESIGRKGPLMQEEAIRALWYFKSDANIALLKSIVGRSEPAYETLRNWGVAVEKPKLREEIGK